MEPLGQQWFTVSENTVSNIESEAHLWWWLVLHHTALVFNYYNWDGYKEQNTSGKQ